MTSDDYSVAFKCIICRIDVTAEVNATNWTVDIQYVALSCCDIRWLFRIQMSVNVLCIIIIRNQDIFLDLYFNLRIFLVHAENMKILDKPHSIRIINKNNSFGIKFDLEKAFDVKRS